MSVPGAVATGSKHVFCDPVATAPGTDFEFVDPTNHRQTRSTNSHETTRKSMWRNAADTYRQGAALWRQRLDEDKPEPIKGFEDVQIYQMAWSPDGKTLAYTRGANMQEIMLLQNPK